MALITTNYQYNGNNYNSYEDAAKAAILADANVACYDSAGTPVEAVDDFSKIKYIYIKEELNPEIQTLVVSYIFNVVSYNALVKDTLYSIAGRTITKSEASVIAKIVKSILGA